MQPVFYTILFTNWCNRDCFCEISFSQRKLLFILSRFFSRLEKLFLLASDSLKNGNASWLIIDYSSLLRRIINPPLICPHYSALSRVIHFIAKAIRSCSEATGFQLAASESVSWRCSVMCLPHVNRSTEHSSFLSHQSHNKDPDCTIRGHQIFIELLLKHSSCFVALRKNLCVLVSQCKSWPWYNWVKVKNEDMQVLPWCPGTQAQWFFFTSMVTSVPFPVSWRRGTWGDQLTGWSKVFNLYGSHSVSNT